MKSHCWRIHSILEKYYELSSLFLYTYIFITLFYTFFYTLFYNFIYNAIREMEIFNKNTHKRCTSWCSVGVIKTHALHYKEYTELYGSLHASHLQIVCFVLHCTKCTSVIFHGNTWSWNLIWKGSNIRLSLKADTYAECIIPMILK